MNPKEYVKQTIELVSQIETRFLELGARLYTIRTKELWLEGSFDTYYDFLEAANINPSMASRLYSIHKHYVIDGGKSVNSLAGIGYSNLYEAIPLIEARGVDKTVTAASTLSRSEIKDEVREKKHGDHRHTVGKERWAKCGVCDKFIRINDEKED